MRGRSTLVKLIQTKYYQLKKYISYMIH